jgi:hypothetical protein
LMNWTLHSESKIIVFVSFRHDEAATSAEAYNGKIWAQLNFSGPEFIFA